VSREQSADGSALAIYTNGSVLILESDLAEASVLQAGAAPKIGCGSTDSLLLNCTRKAPSRAT
jgi:hypothetical protein